MDTHVSQSPAAGRVDDAANLPSSTPYNFVPRVHMGMRVHVGDNTSGTVVDVLIDRSSRCSRFIVVNYGGFFGIDVVMPIGWLSRIDDTYVTTTVTMAEIFQLPRYTVSLFGPAQGLLSQCAGRYDRRPSRH